MGTLIKTVEQRAITQEYGDWYTDRWWVGCYIWYSDEGPGWTGAPPSPLVAVPILLPHVDAHSTPSRRDILVSNKTIFN